MLRSMGFLGVRTDAYEATVALYRDVLGLEPILERPGATWFRASDGAQVHVYGPTDEDHEFFGRGPVVGLVVDDFDAARAAMVAAGIEFIGEPQRDGESAWNHYRGPDGNVYEIIGPDRDAR
ncbi:MAG TPA: VOC family protein [Candidatus Limnocylindrales bacterium]|nr:VOC family protein [Candidatus Limnocylindrales bacterium]